MFNTQKSDDRVNTEKYRNSKLHQKKNLHWYRIGSVSADPQNLRDWIGSVLKKWYRCIPNFYGLRSNNELATGSKNVSKCEMQSFPSTLLINKRNTLTTAVVGREEEAQASYPQSVRIKPKFAPERRHSPK